MTTSTIQICFAAIAVTIDHNYRRSPDENLGGADNN